ncbi:MAG: tyrosine-protein phosphatase [Oscillospiraceae bacterium]|nr:tyrosine-protein phosphatase [Oscillospiraceae bacterium]MDD4368758.1 tyrosine-protein phosphatase [Oscillospiraceae bacterium]
MNCRRLVLQHTYNTRDLGGYPTPDGMTRWHEFYRSDDLTELSERDIRSLQQTGVTDLIDLRSDEERFTYPYPEMHGFSVHYAPLAVGEVSDLTTLGISDLSNLQISDFYMMWMEKSKPQINKIFTAFSQAEGASLFHCRAGKDRTGIIAMLLLGLAGVSEADILTDYQMTYTYIRLNQQLTASVEKGLDDPWMHSDIEQMDRVLLFLKERYGSVWGYLNSGCGLPELTLEAVRNRLVEKTDNLPAET